MVAKGSNINEIYDILKNRILTCEYQPGQMIFEKDIVDEFEVSRTPIREILNVLNGEGLVKIIPKKGIMISQLSIKMTKQIYEMRKILEPIAISQAINHIKDNDIENLVHLDKSLNSSVDNNNSIDIFKYGMDIHLYIANLTGNETLVSILKWLRQESYRGYVYYLKQFMYQRTDAEIKAVEEKIVTNHSKIIEALKEKNEQEAIRNVIMDLDTFNLFASDR